jgi:hypothetical protein
MLALTKAFFKFNVFLARKIKALFVRQTRKESQNEQVHPPESEESLKGVNHA